MERLAQNSTIDLQQHQREVENALIAAVEQGPAKTSGATAPNAKSDDLFVSEVMLAAVGGGRTGAKVLSSFMAAEGSSSPGTASLFVGGALGKAARRSTPIVPQTYTEKKIEARAAAKAAPAAAGKAAGIAERSQVASMSLTGSAATGGKSTQIKGVAVTPAMATAVGVGWMLDELAITQRTQRDPYENSQRRLVQDLTRGIDAAEQYAQRKPMALNGLMN